MVMQQACGVARRKSAPPGWTEFARELGHNLGRARIARGMSQARLSAMADIAENTYQRYEKGESGPGDPINMELMTLLALCQALDLRVDDLLPSAWPDMLSGG